MLSNSLQQTFSDFNCIVLNYTNGRILTNFFFSLERYENYKNGSNCIQGNGVYSLDQELKFEVLDDNKVVIIQHDGVEQKRYKYIPIFRPTIDYRNKENKKATITLSIRKNYYDKTINIFIDNNDANDFKNMEEVKQFLTEKYGTYRIIEWDLYL